MRGSLARTRSLLEDTELVSGKVGLKPKSGILAWTLIPVLFCVYSLLRENEEKAVSLPLGHCLERRVKLRG